MSNHTGPVVVGVDGSTTADAAEQWAYDEADSRGVGLLLVAAYPRIDSWAAVAAHPQVLVPSDATVRDEIEDLMAVRAARLRRRGTRVDVSFRTVDEDAGTALQRESGTASMIVLGSRRRGALRSAVLGSVGTALCARALCPVVVVRQPDATLADGAGVVVGVQSGVDCEDAVAFAFDHASRHRLPLVALMCWLPDTMTLLQGDVTVAPTAVAAELSEALAGWREKYPDVVVREQIVLDHAVEGLLFASTGQHLLVVGSRGRGPVSGMLLGSVSQDVLHHATCPVAVIGPARQ